MRDFLLEIGTEEVPASFLNPAAEALKNGLAAWFKDNRVSAGEGELFYTPRRLAILVRDVAEQQEAKTVELQGPPRRAAFDSEGKPTKTALGFAKTHGMEVSELTIKTTPKGEYVFVTKTIEAQPTGPLLENVLPDIIAKLPFPKNMRWAEAGFRFARPIRWLLALLGDKHLSFKVEDVVSGNVTHGLRRLDLETDLGIVVASPAEYEPALEQAGIVADPDKRKASVLRAVQACLTGTGGEIVADDELLDETAGIVEAPKPILCRFRPEYLSLPPIVVVTALKKHQRCFSVKRSKSQKVAKSEDQEALMPLFVAVTNTPGCDEKSVAEWYEKAAESRLKDARFFIEEDSKIGLKGFLDQERGVTWVEGLGTLRDKTERLRNLSALLAKSAPGAEVDSAALEQAALLCKADLLTNMVREKEYTSLQGIIGGVYALTQGESDRTALAIRDHYAPHSIGDPLPDTNEGKLLSIADKLDNLCAAFATGSIPTGSVDPFALRRQTTGLLSIILDLNWQFDLRAALKHALELLKCCDETVMEKLCGFTRERLNLLLADRGVKYDIGNAVLETSWTNPADALQRCLALADYRRQEEFEKLVIGQKRVANILKGVSLPSQGARRLEVNEKLLEEKAELALYDRARALESGLAAAVAKRDYREAFALLLSLRPIIDTFFDEVMVMCDDQELSTNRLTLLNYVKTLFLRVADLSQIVIEK